VSGPAAIDRRQRTTPVPRSSATSSPAVVAASTTSGPTARWAAMPADQSWPSTISGVRQRVDRSDAARPHTSPHVVPTTTRSPATTGVVLMPSSASSWRQRRCAPVARSAWYSPYSRPSTYSTSSPSSAGEASVPIHGQSGASGWLQRRRPVARSSAPKRPSTPVYTTPSAMVGPAQAERAQPLVSSVRSCRQRGAPVASSTAWTWPPVSTTTTTPSATAGAARTGVVVASCQRGAPVVRSNATRPGLGGGADPPGPERPPSAGVLTSTTPSATTTPPVSAGPGSAATQASTSGGVSVCGLAPR
jgi:hypothetical protein